jgi:hypothetical protein
MNNLEFKGTNLVFINLFMLLDLDALQQIESLGARLFVMMWPLKKYLNLKLLGIANMVEIAYTFNPIIKSMTIGNRLDLKDLLERNFISNFKYNTIVHLKVLHYKIVCLTQAHYEKTNNIIMIDRDHFKSKKMFKLHVSYAHNVQMNKEVTHNTMQSAYN